jgi:hypothetical protein
MQFKLKHDCPRCAGKKVQLCGVNELSFKGVTATFEGVCVACGMYVHTQRRAGVGVMRSWGGDGRLLYKWVYNGRITKVGIAVPYSMLSAHGETEFWLGTVKLKLIHRHRTFTGMLPESWLTDISGEVVEQLETL